MLPEELQELAQRLSFEKSFIDTEARLIESLNEQISASAAQVITEYYSYSICYMTGASNLYSFVAVARTRMAETVDLNNLEAKLSHTDFQFLAHLSGF